MGGQKQIKMTVAQALQAVPGGQRPGGRPVVPFQVVGLVQGAAGVDGVAAKTQLLAAPFDDIAEGARGVTRRGDGAKARRANVVFAVGAQVGARCGDGQARRRRRGQPSFW